MLSSLIFMIVVSLALSVALTWLWNRRPPVRLRRVPLLARVTRPGRGRPTPPPPSFRPPRDWR